MVILKEEIRRRGGGMGRENFKLKELRTRIFSLINKFEINLFLFRSIFIR